MLFTFLIMQKLKHKTLYILLNKFDFQLKTYHKLQNLQTNYSLVRPAFENILPQSETKNILTFFYEL